MTMTRFNMTKDINGLNGFGAPPSNTKFQFNLPANTVVNLTVPPTGDATYQNVLVVFAFQTGSSIWVSYNGTPTLPGNSVPILCASELNPGARYLKGGDVLGFVTSDSTDEVGVFCYAAP